MQVKARMAGEPALHRGRLVRAVVVQDQVDVELRRDVRRRSCRRNCTELAGAVTPMQLADHLAGRHDRAPRTTSWCRGACSRGCAARARQGAAAAAVACDPAPGSASSRRRTAPAPASAACRYRPTMSRTLSMNSGSVDSLKVSVRCGCKPKARQIRCTVVWVKPARLGHRRVLQCVASAAGAQASSPSPVRLRHR